MSSQLQKLTLPTLIILLLILKFPSFFEPYWYGDELIRLLVGKAWFGGKVLYSQIFDNSPPLLYVIFGITQNLLGLKILATVFTLASFSVFYFIAQEIAKLEKFPKKYILFSSIIFIFLISTPVLEGNIATAENFALLPALAGIFLVLSHQDTNNNFPFLTAGSLFAAASLIRIQTLTDFATVAVFLLFLKKPKTVIFAILAFSLIWLAVFVSFAILGNLGGLIKAVFLGNFAYVNYTSQLGVPFGFVLLKTLILFFILIILFKLKKFLGNSQTFIALWLSFSIFGALLGGRAYAHYFLQIAAPLSLLLAQILKLNIKNISQTTLFVSITIVVAVFVFFWPKVLSYYLNFPNYFVNSQKYSNWFDPRITQSEKISEFIKLKTSPNDKILILGNLPEIYLMAERQPFGKYVVSYHLNFQSSAREETLESFGKNPPKIVVVAEEGKKDFPKLVELLPKTHQLVKQTDTSQIWEKKF